MTTQAFKICCVLTLTFICYTHYAKAQKSYQPYLLHWNEKDGLCDNNVYQVVKDQYGYLWISSSNGVSRFDGNNFETFRYDPKQDQSVAANEIVKLQIAQSGDIWIGTDGGGLSVFDYQKGIFRNLHQNLAQPLEGLNENRVYSFWEDEQKNMLVGYRAIGSGTGGLTIVDSNLTVKQHVLQNVFDYAGFPMKIYHIHQHSSDKNNFWLGGRSFFSWNRADDRYQEYPHPGFKPNYNSISGILEETDSTLFVGLHFDGLWIFNHRQGTWVKKIHDSPISSFCKDEQGQIWLVDKAGVGWMDQNTYKVTYELNRGVENSPFPNQTSINSITAHDNIIWLGTSKGLFAWTPIFQQFNTQYITYAQNQKANLPEFIGAINDNTWCFLNRGKGLILTDINLHPKKIINLPEAKDVRKALMIKENGVNHVLIGASNGLFSWDYATNRFQAYRPINSQFSTDSVEVWSMFYQKGNLWVGTRLFGLLKINLANDSMHVFRHEKANLQSLCHDKYLFEIDQDDNGNLWVCTDKGLSILNPDTDQFIIYDQLKELQSFVIHALEQDESGNMWIGTRNRGLFRFHLPSRKLSQYTVSDGLSYNGVNKLLYKDEQLWMATQEGLCRMDIANEQIIVFDERKGLLDRTLYNGRLETLPDDRIMLTYNASSYFSLFKNQSLSADINPPEVAINDLIILDSAQNNRRYLYDLETIDLSPQENYFTIRFQGIDFLQTKNLRYEYQLENYHDYWINAGTSTTAVFTNIPGGKYLFKVRAINQDQRVSTTQQLLINVATPWYKTTWFYTLAALTFGFLVYAAYYYRIRQIRRQETFKQQLAELEMKALRSQINPHFIFNCLNSIKGYIIDNRIEDGTHYVGQFAQLIRMILNHSKERLIPLTKEIEAIRLYVWLEQERLSNGFSVNFELALNQEDSTLFIPPLLFQPYIENAIWHGLMPLPHKGGLQIKIKEQAEHLKIEIMDNGIGRKASQQRKQVSVFDKPSLGLEISENRLAQIKQLYGLKPSVTIEDINPKNEYPGTIVTILFPKIKPNEKT